MARARNIKPGFFTNEELVELPFSTRLLFIGLWTIADRDGRLEDRPKRIKIELFPCDNLDVNKALNELAARGFIIRYEVEGGRFIQVVNFEKHQSPHIKEAPSTIPAPGEHHTSTGRAALNEDSLIPDSLNEDSLIVGKRARTNRATLFPDAFDPPYAWAAEELGVDAAFVDAAIPQMRDWSHSKGESRKDWTAFARNWLRKEHADRQRSRASPNGSHSGDSALDYFKSQAVKGQQP
jgi:hypothetical protein